MIPSLQGQLSHAIVSIGVLTAAMIGLGLGIVNSIAEYAYDHAIFRQRSRPSASAQAKFVSVVIATYRELSLEKTLLQLVGAATNLAALEIIVVEAGSSDAPAVAATHAVLASLPLGLWRRSLHQSRSGRGTAMAAGARHAAGDLVVFLHADCRLPRGFDDLLRQHFADPTTVATFFRLRIDDDCGGGGLGGGGQGGNGSCSDGGGWSESLLPGVRAVEACTAWGGRLCGVSFGDQALATRTAAARHLMPQVPILEDVAFMRLARREARLTGCKVAATATYILTCLDTSQLLISSRLHFCPVLTLTLGRR